MRAVQEQRITVLPGPPTIYQALLDHPKRGDYDLSSLRFAVTGAAVVPVVLIERMQPELGIDNVVTAFGMTEANGRRDDVPADDDAATVATTCGRPIADFELRIDSPAEDGAGEVLLRGPNVMLGYLDDPEATAAAIDADGWLRTGDVGRVDDAGNLTHHRPAQGHVHLRRIQRLPRRGRAGAGPAGRCRRVRGLGVPDERLGEVGKAYVVAADATLDEETVIAFARERLANFKMPRSVEFLDALPRNLAGKVLKPLLRERRLMDLNFDDASWRSRPRRATSSRRTEPFPTKS